MKNRLVHFTALIALFTFMLAECIIGPSGEFPLNDDWAYAISLQHYLNTGQLHFSFWQAIPGLTQFVLGSGMIKIAGFSFTALRCFSLVCVALMIFLMDALMKLFEIERKFRLPAQLLFVLNPLTLYLGNTYLPDMLQLLLCFTAFTCMVFWFKTSSFNYFIAFTFFSIAATLNRQTGLLIPLSLGIALICMRERNLKNIFFASIPFVLSLSALFIFETIARSKQLLPLNYGLQLNSIFYQLSHPAFSLFKKLAYYALNLCLSLGLFLSPLILAGFGDYLKKIRSKWTYWILLLLFFIGITLKTIYSHKFLPFSGNIFRPDGIGPIVMTGFNTDESSDLSLFSKIIWTILGFIGGFSFFTFCIIIFDKAKELTSERKFFLLSFILIFVFYSLPLCVNYFNDRYLILLFPFCFILFFFCETKLNNDLFYILLLVISLYGIAAVHDHMELNRSREQAVSKLFAEGIAPAKIDGGFEFNAWYFSESRAYDATHKGRWWWVKDEEYIVSPAFLPGYRLHARYPFTSYLQMDKNYIYVWKKE